ncbi:MAG: histidine phosphatase family protein [Clostridia bacterium]
MRKLYLIRHAMPAIPFGERWCVGGNTDLPLNALGRMQAALLPSLPELRGVTAVFCSPLSRARETALPLCGAPRVIEGLEEQRMGVWDGLSFAEIRARFPALYAAREADLSILPEGAEPLEAVRARMLAALRRCLAESEGDIAVVSHRTALATVIGRRELLLHGSVSVLAWAEDPFAVEAFGLRPHPPLTPALAETLLRAAAPGGRVEAHCRAVAAEAMRLADALPLALDRELLESAALLHDVARGEKDHARLGAAWLRELGYEEAAAVVAQHHDRQDGPIDEAALLFLADKSVREDRRVTLEERFAESEKRCLTPEAKAAHAARREAALRLRDEVNRICGKILVE